MSHEVFWSPPETIAENRITISGDEFKHAVRVKRHRLGSIVTIIDGVGSAYRVKLVDVGRDQAVGEILETHFETGEPDYKLTMGVAPPKNRARFEDLLEKATELGVSRIWPFASERTERSRINEERSRRILVSATKQSGRSRIPDLGAVTSLNDILKSAPGELRLILHERERSRLLLDLSREIARQDRLTIIVGPEGGFSESEVRTAGNQGWLSVSLGPHRLRSGTAGIAAAAAVSLLRAPRNVDTAKRRL